MASAKVKNDWIGYLDRSYQQIKNSLLTRLGISNPELSDHSESNPLIIFISMFSGIAEMLGFYIDNMAEESYIATAQRTTSVVKHSRALDYRIRTRAPETVDLLIDWSIAVPVQFTIPAGATIVSIQDSISFISLTNIIVPMGATATTLPVAQITEVNNPTFALTTGIANQRISLGNDYVHNSLQLTIDGDDYVEVETFANKLPTDKVYIIDVFEDNNAYIVLGDGINAFKPAGSLIIAATYRTTLGPNGKVGAGLFDEGSVDLGVVLPGALAIDSINSVHTSSGGVLYEDIESIRKFAPISLRTLDRMVTRQDHKDIMEMVPGVAKADVQFNCGKNIYLYIAPDGGGIPSTLLVAAAQARADETKMGGTFPVIRAAGETRLVLGADVVAKKRKSLIETQTQVINALVEFGNIENQEINGSIRLSDLQALIDNLPNVEYVDLTRMYTIPFARPINHGNPLVWNSLTTSASTARTEWRVEYDGSAMRVFKNRAFQVSIPMGDEYDDTAQSGVKFTISAGAYSPGNVWEFTTYPFLKNLTLTDFTLFTIQASDIQLNVSSLPSTQI